jgi:hypothetical protein
MGEKQLSLSDADEIRRMLLRAGEIGEKLRLPKLGVHQAPGAAGIHGTLSENPTKTHYFEQYTTSKRTIKKS